jgi:hypothetical protein
MWYIGSSDTYDNTADVPSNCQFTFWQSKPDTIVPIIQSNTPFTIIPTTPTIIQSNTIIQPNTIASETIEDEFGLFYESELCSKCRCELYPPLSIDPAIILVPSTPPPPPPSISSSTSPSSSSTPSTSLKRQGYYMVPQELKKHKFDVIQIRESMLKKCQTEILDEIEDE